MNGFLETRTGRTITLPNFEGVFDIMDISWALSMQCRFNGHCSEFYSVAEHSFLVSHMVPKEHALCGLLHDATEAYMGDMISPLKDVFPEFRILEQKLWVKLANHFGLPEKMPAAVHQSDIELLYNEARILMVSKGDNWKEWLKGVDPDNVPMISLPLWSPQEARDAFLGRYYELVNGGRYA